MSLTSLKRAYWWLVHPETSPLESFRDLFRARDVDLERTLIADRRWERGISPIPIPEDGFHLSTPLPKSPHVAFLEQYEKLGEEIFEWRHFEQTAYFYHATRVIAHAGHYFHTKSPEGIQRQARYFAALYERIRTGNGSEMERVPGSPHTSRSTLPMVHETLTRGTTQILNGHHRLAISWVMGKKQKRVIIRPQRATELQRLVLASAEARGMDPRRHELLQPIEAPEFDSTWPVVDRCEARLQVMRRLLSAQPCGTRLTSVLVVGCTYGWFVMAFSRACWHAVGVDEDAAGVKIGRSAYGLTPAQLIHEDAIDFLRRCEREFDVVLCLTPRRLCGQAAGADACAALVEALERVTGCVLFLGVGPNRDVEPASASWDRASLAGLVA